MGRQQIRSRLGVGSRIKNALAWAGLKPTPKCGCIELAAEMDRVGPYVVEQKIEEYTTKMQASIKEWIRETKSHLPNPPRLTVKELILWSCEKTKAQLF